MVRRAVMVAALAACCCLVAGCGSSDHGSTGTKADKRPVVRLGTKNFTEQFVVGQLYAQALRAKGFHVKVEQDLGSSEIVDRALTSGAIDVYPEYTGVIVQEIAREHRRPHTAEETYRRAKAFEAGRGFELLDMSPGYDRLANAVTAATARRHGLRTMADLKRLGRYRYGGFPENRVRFQGAVGARRVYGLDFSFVPLPSGGHYKALDGGDVDVIDVGTTEAQVADRDRYRVLEDPQGIFGFQNLAPVVSRAAIRAQGPGLARTLDAVTGRLTNAALQTMNAAVDVRGEQPAAVATRFLRRHQLL
jgi:osmoprotectant transport system substrate-binding protein